MTRTPETLAYLAHHLRQRAAQLLARAASRCNPLPIPAVCSLTATAYRALARAAQLTADLHQALGRITPMAEAAEQARTYGVVASAYAHAADLRGA
mgnify:CR=1 FL=1